MRKLFFTLFVLLPMAMTNAKVNVDFSSKFEEGTNTINCLSSWGWYSTSLNGFEIEECEYLYIQYDASCNFNLILRDENWQTAYSVTCKSTDKEAFIQLAEGKKTFADVVLQNHAVGAITVNKFYFCTETEFYNPAPDDLEEARDNLAEIHTRYLPYLDDTMVGDGYGMYPSALYEAFATAMTAAEVLDTEEGKNLTVEELNALSQAIVDAYRALVAGKRMYLPEDGYYRFICARQFYQGDEETGYTYYTKGIYSSNSGENGWKTLDREDPAFLWILQRQEDNTYVMRNAANRLILSEPEKCAETEHYITFDAINKTGDTYSFNYPLSTEEDVVIFNFRMSTAPAHDYKYIHAKGHNGGNGEAGPMTTWCTTTYENGASEWYIEMVGEDEAQALLNANNYGYKFSQMLAEAKENAAIANDRIRVKLITEAEQFSSPFSQNDLGKRDGGDLSEGVLIDGNTSTFWHSVWSEGSVEMGEHYLQIELAEEVGGEIEFDFSRRNTSGNQIIKWGIYGSDSPSGQKYDYEWIADLDTPYGEPAESLVTHFTIEDGKTYSYLRFYAEDIKGSSNGYFHISEFQLYSLQDNPDNQASHMGEVYTNLMEAIAQAETVNLDAVTKADYDALAAAYEPFMAVFVNPVPLREAIEAAEPALALCLVGTNPGQWNEEVMEALSESIEDAKVYDQSGIYTQAQTNAYVATLSGAQDKFLAAANRVSPDKYYTIRFASEELYEEQGWSTINVISESYGDLFDTYLCPANPETLARTATEDIRQGSYMFFTDDDKADIAFRFIPITEDTYIIQHVASGLFIQCYGRDSWTGLTLNPTLFTIEAVGHGENIIRGCDYAGKDMACLHAQLSGHRLVTWHDDYVGCNSGLLIEELLTQGQPGSPFADFKPGEITTFCYPVCVAPSEGQLYTVAGTWSGNDKMYVALNQIDSAEAGQPVVYIPGGDYDEENETDQLTVTLNVGTAIATEPLNEGALKGTYNSLDLTEEAIVFVGNKCEASTEETAHVSSNHAYVVPGAVEADAAGVYSLVLEVGGVFTSVNEVLHSVARKADVYDTVGRKVRQSATLNDVRALPRGTYIFNNIKILVK